MEESDETRSETDARIPIKIDGAHESYCLCGSNKVSPFMILCDNCGVWYHGECLQVTRTQSKMIDVYVCPPCISKDNSLQILYHDKKKQEISVPDRSMKKKQREFDKTSVLSVQSDEDNFKAEAELYSKEDRCENCINCFRSTNCNKCVYCNASLNLCLKRICVKSEWWINVRKKSQPSKVSTSSSVQTSEEYRRSPSHQFVPKVLKKPTGAIKKQGKGVIEKGKLGRKRGRKAIQKKDLSDDDQDEKIYDSNTENLSDENTREKRKKMSTVYRDHLRRAGKLEPHTERVKQCMNPDCTKSSRWNSKYCSDECGLTLARIRLRQFLPMKMHEYWDNLPNSSGRINKLLSSVENQIQEISTEIRIFGEFQNQLLDWMEMIKDVEPSVNEDDSISGSCSQEPDYVLHCPVCTLQFPSKVFDKHVERCFNRTERQIAFGTPIKALVNPYNIFCDQLNKSNNSYCKRLRVLCSEHYKPGPEANLKVCGYPLAWTKLDMPSVYSMFSNMEGIKSEGHCMLPRKQCGKHTSWFQTSSGLIDIELMNRLFKLDELYDKKRQLQLTSNTQGDVLSLLCNRTISFQTLVSEEIKTNFSKTSEKPIINDIAQVCGESSVEESNPAVKN